MPLPSPARTARPARPNVILILTDDQGYGDLGRNGNSVVRTPHLDRLHDTSLHFSRFHVSPTCSPTRAALMTGRHEFRSGVSHTILGRSLLRPTAATLPAVLAGAGYDTGLFGKWHLGDNYPCRPMDVGFAEALYHGGGGITQTPDWWGNTYTSPTLLHNGEPRATEGYCTDVLFRAASEWITRERDRPFFCYLPTNAPHRPLQAPDGWEELYHDAPVDDDAKRFYAMISNIDENVGRLMALLSERGLDRETLVIFLGDNGSAETGDRRRGLYNAGMRGAKGSEHEGGTRVPCLWHQPAVYGAARGIDKVCAHIDLLPTLAELCGATVPGDPPLDGRSLVPLLTDPDGAWPDRMLVTHVGRWNAGEDPEAYRLQRCSVRSARYRWLPSGELYDLIDDPGETTDVAGTNRRQVARMAAFYEEWWQSVRKSLGEPVRIGLGGPENPSRLTCHDWHRSVVATDPRQQQMCIWEQSALAAMAAGRGAPQRDGTTVQGAMGAWAVAIERPGRYEFTLRKLPPEAEATDRALAAGTALLLCGEQRAETAVAAGDTEAVLKLELSAGPAWLEAWFTGQRADGLPGGAFFVEARLVG